MNYRVGDALYEFGEEAGDFDVVYCDVDKDGYTAGARRATTFGSTACGYVTTGTDREDRCDRLHPGTQPAGGRGHPRT
jgi:hypothetical protein